MRCTEKEEKKLAVWYTSDLHIDHNSVAHHRWHAFNGNPRDFDDDVLHDADIIAWHNNLLAANWDALVRKDDVVYVVGDISSGSSNGQRNALDWIKARPGRKKLILGNHDGPFPNGHDKSGKWLRAYLDAFASVSMMDTHKIAGHKVMVSHFPYSGDHGDHDRYQQYRLRPIDRPIIHGHTHSSGKWSAAVGSGGKILPQVQVGVDAWNFSPVSLDQVIGQFGFTDLS